MRTRLNPAPFAALLALCAACATPPPDRAAAAGRATTAIAVPTPYLAPGTPDVLALIEPPPLVGSIAAQRDLQAVLDAQRAAHAAGTTARAVADAQPSCLPIADVLTAEPEALLAGPGAAALEFALRAAREASAATAAAKDYWKRARPFVISSAVERLADVTADAAPAAGAHSRDYTSYPSGHAALGAACALVLAQLVPEQRAALFARGRAFGQSRLIVGAHFPTDIEAGRVVATAALALMLREPRFQVDLSAARTALRTALRLPPQPPDLEPKLLSLPLTRAGAAQELLSAYASTARISMNQTATVETR